MSTITTGNAAKPSVVYDDSQFDSLAAAAQAHFAQCVSLYGPNVFTTTVDGTALFNIYLDAFADPVQRQGANCHCCRRFFEAYGGLVFIDPATGAMVPAVWPEANGQYADPVKAVKNAILAGRVTGVFLDSDAVWKRNSGSAPQWHHFQIDPRGLVPQHRDRLNTPFQVMAAKREDFNTVSRALSEFSPEVVDVALQILEGDALYRSEKILGQARWLKSLHDIRKESKGAGGTNRIWLEIAKAPAGFCHPRSSVIGTLLEDLAAGKSFDAVKRAFDAKMHPSVYQRPQALPSAGNVRQAEEIIAKMGVQKSLHRRFATLADMRNIVWQPKKDEVKAAEGGGVFGHLKTKKDAAPEVRPMNLPVEKITWEKFARKVLPNAKRIEFMVEERSDSYCAFVTAADPSAPPILQWDLEDERNPVSWYLYIGGSRPSRWGLRSGTMVDVEAIVEQPNMWSGDGFPHQGVGVLLVLKGCRDQNNGSIALFPESLRSEFHSIRSTIEAFSRSKQLVEVEGQLASGIKLTAGWGGGINSTVRVTTPIGIALYHIDRWD